MNIEEYRDFCLSLYGVEEGFPFDQNTLVFKAGNKIFALLNLENFEFINLKCDPEKALELRESNAGIKPGWHMNKKHWNSVYINSDVSDKLILDLTTHSYDLIVKSLPVKIRAQFI